MKNIGQRAIAIVTILIATVTYASATEPFLELELSVPRILRTLERIAPEEAKADAEFTAKMTLIRDLNLGSAYLFLYPDQEFKFLPVLIVRSPNPLALQNLLTKDDLLARFVEKTADSSYKLKAEFLTEEALAGMPLDEYRIWATQKTLLFAPISMVDSWKAGAPQPMASRVAKTAATLKAQGHAFACAIQIPENIKDKDWKDVSSELPIPAGEQSAMITGVGTDLISEMSDAFSTIDSFAFGFQLGANKQRVIEYTQQFRNSANVVKLFKNITQGRAGTGEPTDLIEVLSHVIQSDAVTMSPTLNGKNLSLKVSWAPAADQTVLESIGGYLMGKVMGAAMSGMEGMEITMEQSETEGTWE
jgi:hypothetical protein